MSDDLVTIEIDGKPLKAKKGAMVIQVADDAGIYIPRFCYHEKLSVAANCRMCLVEVEKAPKPLPACATPVADGMKVFTESPKAVSAQKAVMEFLLINHPLDCPVCDQGGECELQDLAMGFGSDVSRYTERKRIIKDENIGPLISTDMTRCIHCTRCVRFGTEIAGIQELGAVGRGENMRIRTFIARSVDHELSGNVIDLCPVGALNSKPFRMRGRAWEMISQQLVSPHDAAGSSLFGHVLRGKYMRTVPRANEAVNETWISDRDRFGYEGVHANDRLQKPMVKTERGWQEVTWETALEAAAKALKDIPADELAVLASPSSTVEEFFLARRIADHLGVRNVDHRVRQGDFAGDAGAPAFPTLGRSIASLDGLDAALVVGSSLRKDVPIVAHRIRKAAMKGAKISFVNPRRYDFLFPVANESIVAYADMAASLAGIAQELARVSGKALPENLKKFVDGIKPGDAAAVIAQQLLDGKESAVILGDLAETHPQYADLRSLAVAVAEMAGASFGQITGGANSAGGWLAGMVPQDGLNARDMFAQPRKGYMLLGVEPEMDCWDGATTLDALKRAEQVVAMTSFVTDTMKEYATVLLPIGTFGETAGSYINLEGTWQTFGGASRPIGEVRPAWKVLRVLGNLLGVENFEYMSPDDVTRAARETIGEPVAGMPKHSHALRAVKSEGFIRVAETALYGTDPLVRRAGSLQVTADAKRQAAVNLSTADAARLGVTDGMYVTVRQDARTAILPVVIDDGVVNGSAFVAAGVEATATLGPRTGAIEIVKAEERS